MTVYLLGSRGPEVLQIQRRLDELQCYSGPADGVFGGGTESAVRAYQRTQGLTPDSLGRICGTDYSALVAMLAETRDEQLAWARSIQDPIKKIVFEPWQGQFKTLGRQQEFQDIEAKYAAGLFQKGLALCNDFGVSSQRAAALMFDLYVQNGGIKSWVKPLILSDFEQLQQSGQKAGDAPLEVARLRIIAVRAAASANPKWIADVQNRKLTIANGEGTVHGNPYNLEEQYGISLDSAFS